jgi:hypothetical protein
VQPVIRLFDTCLYRSYIIFNHEAVSDDSRLDCRVSNA